jgi:hypothetical protein
MTKKQAWHGMLGAKRRRDHAVDQQILTLKMMREKFGDDAIQKIAAEESEAGETMRHALKLEREAEPGRN